MVKNEHKQESSQNQPRIYIFSGFQASAALTLPDVILGNYTLTYDDSDTTWGPIVNNTLNTCSQTSLMQFVNSDAQMKLAYSGNEALCTPEVTCSLTT